MKCIDAYKNLNIVSDDNQLAVSPCCLVTPTAVESIDFTSVNLTQIRETLSSGKFPNECHACKRAEDAGNLSRRLASNNWYTDNNHDNTDVELIRLDYQTGNLCNLRCAICGPHYSSAWKEELNLPTELKHVNVNQFWRTLDLSKIKFIHFTGGEPLLSKEHVIFLQSIPDKSKVHINYNTNGTIIPSAELLELWAQFRLVQIDFSIDDIGERFEYQRYPANWKTVTENLQWFIDNCPVNCMFGVNTTVSVLNRANLTTIKSWLESNFHSNRVTDPVEHRQQLAVGLFSIDTVDANYDKIMKFLDDCDSRRGTNWRTVFPELLKSI